MSGSAQLERSYRRLVAWYPRSFRRENEEEIITVLLATAPDGQRRPGLAETADLIRGAMRMRMGLSRTPHTVLNAVRLMYLGAVAELGTLVVLLLTEGSIRAAVAHRYPQLTVAQLGEINTVFIVDTVGGVLAILAWVFLAWANGRGSQFGRLGAIVCFVLSTTGLVSDLADQAPQFAPAAFTCACLVWLIGLAAIVNLLRKPSWAYFERRPA
jgi:hypothetical protein